MLKMFYSPLYSSSFTKLSYGFDDVVRHFGRYRNWPGSQWDWRLVFLLSTTSMWRPQPIMNSTFLTLSVYTKYDAISFLRQPLNKKKQRLATQWDVKWSYLDEPPVCAHPCMSTYLGDKKRHVIISWKSPGIRTLLSGKTQPLTTFFLAGSQMWKTSSHTLVKFYRSFMKSSIWAKRSCPAKRFVSNSLDNQTRLFQWTQLPT